MSNLLQTQNSMQNQPMFFQIHKNIQVLIKKYNHQWQENERMLNLYRFVMKIQHKLNPYKVVGDFQQKFVLKILFKNLENLEQKIYKNKLKQLIKIKEKDHFLVANLNINKLVLQQNIQVLNKLLDNSINNLIKIIKLIINLKIQGKTHQKLQNFIYIIQQKRKTRPYHSESQNNDVKLQNEQSKRRRSWQWYKKHFQKHQQQLKTKYSKGNPILRLIQIQKIQADKNWKNDDGQFGLVERYSCQYKIKEIQSIHKQTNRQIDVNSINQENLKYIRQQGYLIKKKPKQGKKQNFEVQKKILLSIRSKICHSINNYYCSSIQKQQDIQFLYSNYINYRLHYNLEARKFFKILITLCEGLVFLRQNYISHRDLKPDNIMLNKQYVVKIIDFGSACHTRARNIQKQLRVIQQQWKPLMTNRQYNLIYSELPIQLRQKIPQKSYYEPHQLFDIYAFGRILEKFIKQEKLKDQLVIYQTFVGNQILMIAQTHKIFIYFLKKLFSL